MMGGIYNTIMFRYFILLLHHWMLLEESFIYSISFHSYIYYSNDLSYIAIFLFHLEPEPEDTVAIDGSGGRQSILSTLLLKELESVRGED